MFYRGALSYGDLTDGRETGPKRQRIMDPLAFYGSTSAASTYMYNPHPPPPLPHPPYSFVGESIACPVVRLRGLPYDCTETDIADFFRGLDIVDVLFIHKGRKFMGEAFCVLGYALQLNFALQRDRHNIGRRYVEVFRSTRKEYYKAIANEVSDSRAGGGGGDSPHPTVPRIKSSDDSKDLLEHTGILRLRGLPYSADKDDILNFFKGFELTEESVHITFNSAGRPTGESFVEFSCIEDSKAAMDKDRMMIGNRYVELFPSSRSDMDTAISRGRQKKTRNWDGGSNETTENAGVLRMRGLPFSAEKDDILEFFKDFSLSEESVHFVLNSEGKSTGEAFVEFESKEDSRAAMAKNRQLLGNRYIELFLSSSNDLNEAVRGGR